MEIFDKMLYTSVVMYILIMCLILIIKPNFIYDYNNNKFKSFGTEQNETMFPIPILSIIACIVVYFIVILYTFIKLKLV